MSKGEFGERDEANYNWDLAIKRNSLFFGDEAIVGIICHKDEQTGQIQKIERFVAEKEKRGKNTGSLFSSARHSATLSWMRR